MTILSNPRCFHGSVRPVFALGCLRADLSDPVAALSYDSWGTFNPARFPAHVGAVAASFVRRAHSRNARGMDEQHNTIMLLAQWQNGEGDARDRLIARLHPELSQIAAARLRREHGTSLSTGDLINDAVLRLIRMERADLADRHHFMALASRMMRNILVDHARAKLSSKRHHARVELSTQVEGEARFDLAVLDSVLIRLGAIDASLVELVEMRYFGGMTVADIAVVTNLSEATVKRRWQVARAWLTDALSNPIDDA